MLGSKNILIIISFCFFILICVGLAFMYKCSYKKIKIFRYSSSSSINNNNLIEEAENYINIS